MEATKLICPTCAAKIQIARQLPQGAKGKCPRCQTVFVVPEPEEPAPSSPMASPPQLVDDVEEPGERQRKRKKHQPASTGGIMSFAALLIVGGLVLAFVIVMVGVFYYYAFHRAQEPDYIPTLPGQSSQGPTGAPSRPAQ